MKEPKPEEIKELKINDKVVCNYHIDKYNKNILFIKIRKTYDQPESVIESFYATIIELVEKKGFNHIAYLNIK